MRRRLSHLVGLLLLPLAVGCGPKVTPIGPGYVFQPDQKEQRLWQTCEQDAAGIWASGHLYPDPALTEYVNAVLQRLLGSNRQAYLPLKTKVYIVDSPVVNAFALPEGEFFIHTGALGRLRSEAQLAVLLGHELTHSTHRHGFQESQRAYAQTAATQYVSVFSTAGGGNIYRLVSRTSQVITQASIVGYSRDKEREADQVGLILVAQAGYDPCEGAKMFQRMMDATDPKHREPNFLYATHPKMKERVASCEALITKMPPELVAQAHDVGSDRYLKAAVNLIRDEVQRHIAQGKYALADETVEELVKERPDDANSHALAGELCRARGASGDLLAARDAYSRALERDSSCPMALRGLGMMCLKDGSKAEALKHLKAYAEAAKDAPDRAFVLQTIEQLEREQGESK